MAPSLATADVLLRARAKLADGAWTKGEAARDVTGRPVPPASEAAVCWCSMGAVDAAVPLMPAGKAVRAARLAKEMLGTALQARGMPAALAWWNDAEVRRLPEVLALFDEAIALARAA